MINPSIQSRMLVTVIVGLICLVATHLGLNIFYSTVNTSELNSEMEAMALSVSSAFKVENDNLIRNPNVVLDPKFETPGSGLYAVILKDNSIIWKSPSVTTDIPNIPITTSNSVFKPADKEIKYNRFYRKLSPTLPSNYKIMVYSDNTSNSIKLEIFEYALWLALLISFVFIALAQTLSSRWSLNPLKKLMEELEGIKDGQQNKLVNNYPTELLPITEGLNSLLTHEVEQTENYRNSLANLAHSLKTPLTVIRSSMDNDLDDEKFRQNVRTQMDRIDDLVSYQLSLASRQGRSTFTKPQLLEPIATNIVQTLEKIHASSGALCEFEIEENISFPANIVDIQELLGNLLENAFKWCKGTVLLTIKNDKINNQLVIMVEDNGKGVPNNYNFDIIKRGVRADEQVQGHGIGLAIVNDIVNTYNGSLTFTKSEELGGACFMVRLPIKKVVKKNNKKIKKKK